ncbi:hypothetical protein GCK72_010185 [Caenorhabditis remanei]|uniref:Uncharacterized protein n=1 Tax=Caenorhabditis remanei TaxID=31234 RepID=A0A6A5H4Z5_CAERE|nr:hypothetical protein GCK72_010185 [Caenorhabditis remanei]KAF1761926.1 hypothetical protein GCK72_010185 [Caenorhabditis remanei]
MNGLSSKEQPPNESYSKFPEQHSLLESFEEVARTECMKRIFNVIERMPFEKLNNIIQNSNSDDEIEIIKILERKEIITAEDRKDPIYDEIKQRIGKDWKFGVQIIEHVRICLNEVTLDQNLSPMALEVSNSSILRIISDMKHAAEIRSYGKTGQKSESIKKSLLSFIATGIPGLESPSVNTHAEGKAHKAYKKKQEERFLKSKSSFDEDSEDNSSVSSVTVLKAIQCTPKNSNRTVGDSDLLCTSAATPADGHDKGNQSPVVNPKEVYVLEMDINNAVASEESNEARTPSSNVGNLDEETQTDVFGTLAGENIIAEDSTESRQQRTIETDTTREAAISSSSKRDESNSSHVTKPATGEGVDSKKTSATLLHGSNKSAKLMDSTKPTPRPPLETAEPRKESDTILDVANGTTLEPQDTLMNYTTESSPITTEHLASDVQDSSRIVVRPECTTDIAANTSNCLSNTSTSYVPTVPASKVCDVVGEPLTVDIDQESSKSNTATKVLRRSNRKITNTKKMSAEEIGEEDEYDHRKEISAKTRRTRNRRDRKRTSSKKKTDTATTSAPMSSSQTEQVHNSAEEGRTADPLVPPLNYNLYKNPSTLSSNEIAHPAATIDVMENEQLKKGSSPQISGIDPMLADASTNQKQRQRKRKTKTIPSEFPKPNKIINFGTTDSTQAPNPIMIPSNTFQVAHPNQMEYVSQALSSLTNNRSSNQNFGFMNVPFNQSTCSVTEANQIPRASDLIACYQPTTTNFTSLVSVNQVNGSNNQSFPQVGQMDPSYQPFLSGTSELINQPHFDSSYTSPVQLSHQGSTDGEFSGKIFEKASMIYVSINTRGA